VFPTTFARFPLTAISADTRAAKELDKVRHFVERIILIIRIEHVNDRQDAPSTRAAGKVSSVVSPLLKL
jgi:hypothetical protein